MAGEDPLPLRYAASPCLSPLGCQPPSYAAPRLSPSAPVSARLQDGSSPLHKAAYYGQTPVASLLLDRGADVDAKNNVSGGVLGCALVPFPPL